MERLSAAIERSPCRTLMSTAGWLSARGREDFALLGGDGGVGFNELGHDPAHGLDAEGERRHVQQKNVCDVTTEDSALDGGTYGHHFIGIDPLEGSFPKKALTAS